MQSLGIIANRLCIHKLHFESSRVWSSFWSLWVYFSQCIQLRIFQIFCTSFLNLIWVFMVLFLISLSSLLQERFLSLKNPRHMTSCLHSTVFQSTTMVSRSAFRDKSFHGFFRVFRKRFEFKFPVGYYDNIDGEYFDIVLGQKCKTPLTFTDSP